YFMSRWIAIFFEGCFLKFCWDFARLDVVFSWLRGGIWHGKGGQETVLLFCGGTKQSSRRNGSLRISVEPLVRYPSRRRRRPSACGCGWGGEACAVPWLRSAGCARA